MGVFNCPYCASMFLSPKLFLEHENSHTLEQKRLKLHQFPSFKHVEYFINNYTVEVSIVREEIKEKRAARTIKTAKPSRLTQTKKTVKPTKAVQNKKTVKLTGAVHKKTFGRKGKVMNRNLIKKNQANMKVKLLPHNCNYCAKRFSTRGAQTNHQKTHKVQNPEVGNSASNQSSFSGDNETNGIFRNVAPELMESLVQVQVVLPRIPN